MTHSAVSNNNNNVAANQLPFTLSPAAAEAWLQCLSSLGFSDACRHLFSALRGLNRLELSAHQRFQLLEILRSQVLNYSRRFEPYFVEQTFPLNEKVLKIVRFAVQFQMELASGYQQVVDSPACTEIFSQAQQATAIHRTLTAYGVYLLRGAQCYEIPATSFWQHVYGVYRRAEAMRVTNVRVVDQDYASSTNTTASECLHKIALFQLAQPTRLSQAEMGRLYGWLEQNTHLISLRRERAYNLQEAQFYLELSAHRAPQSIDALTSPQPETRYLFLEPQFLELLAANADCAGLAVARRLSPCKDGWQTPEQTQAIVFATGVEGCAALLTANAARVARCIDYAENTHLALSPISQPPRTPLSARVAHCISNRPTKLDQVSRDEIWGNDQPEIIAAHYSHSGLVRFYDSNARAMLIADRQHLRMGQLVAITADNIISTIGVVRAITPALDTSRVWADIEVITGNVTTAHAHVENEKHHRLASLLVTNEDASGAARPTIILPTPLSNGTWITAEQNGQWHNLRLAHLIEATDSFCQYLQTV